MTVRVPMHGVDLRTDGPWALSERAQRYLTRVHRLGEGDLVTAFSRDGVEVDARLVLGETWSLAPTGPHREGLRGAPLTVCYGLPKGDKLDRVARQLTELGVERLVLLSAARSVVKLTAGRADKRRSRLERIAEEAARQSGRADSLAVVGPMSLADALTVCSGGTRLVFDPSGEAALDDVDWTCPATIFVGPEGGFSPEELASLSAAGVQAVHLGPYVLRTETAAPVAAALVLDRIGALS